MRDVHADRDVAGAIMRARGHDLTRAGRERRAKAREFRVHRNRSSYRSTEIGIHATTAMPRAIASFGGEQVGAGRERAQHDRRGVGIVFVELFEQRAEGGFGRDFVAFEDGAVPGHADEERDARDHGVG